MENKSSVLGKGLSAIFTEKNLDLSVIEGAGMNAANQIPVEKINVNPLQPREDFDQEKLKELADSIRLNGLIQPITVKKSGEEYLLISGERRLRAVKLVGLEKIPAFIYEGNAGTKENLLELALIENIHIENLNPMELYDSDNKLV